MLLFICNIGEDYLVMVCEQSHTQIHAYQLALWLQTSKWRSLNSLWNGHGPCFHVEFRECITPSISLLSYIIISLYQYIFIYRHGRSKWCKSSSNSDEISIACRRFRIGRLSVLEGLCQESEEGRFSRRAQAMNIGWFVTQADINFIPPQILWTWYFTFLQFWTGPWQHWSGLVWWKPFMFQGVKPGVMCDWGDGFCELREWASILRTLVTMLCSRSYAGQCNVHPRWDIYPLVIYHSYCTWDIEIVDLPWFTYYRWWFSIANC